MANLSPKQQRFAEEYLVDLNATQAAIRAGYSEKTAKSQGQRLLTKVDIQEEIQRSRDARSHRTEITQDRVLLEYARIAFFDPAKLFGDDGRPLPLTQIDENTRRAIAGLDVCTVGNGDMGAGEIQKFRIANKLTALEQVGKHLGMFQGKQDEGEEPPPIKVEIVRKNAGEKPTS